MRNAVKGFLALIVVVSSSGYVLAQGKPAVPDSDVVKKSIKAVGYEVAEGPAR